MQLIIEKKRHFAVKWRATVQMLAAGLATAVLTLPAAAQAPTPDPQFKNPPGVPGFWDPRRRPERPDLSRITQIRFLTEVDYPPFNFLAPDGSPSGFNVEIARAICEELKTACTVQMRRFDTLVASLGSNQGDAVIASLAVTPQARLQVDFTDPYYRTPARFVSRRENAPKDVRPETLEGRKIGVVPGTAHEAYLKAMFTEATVVPYPTAGDMLAALRRSDVDLVFGDGFALSFWIAGVGSQNCCEFAGGPFVESRFFGEGIGVAVRKGNDQLRLALNWALFRIWEKGRFTDLWLRYFPVSPF